MSSTPPSPSILTEEQMQLLRVTEEATPEEHQARTAYLGSPDDSESEHDHEGPRNGLMEKFSERIALSSNRVPLLYTYVGPPAVGTTGTSKTKNEAESNISSPEANVERTKRGANPPSCPWRRTATKDVSNSRTAQMQEDALREQQVLAATAAFAAASGYPPTDSPSDRPIVNSAMSEADFNRFVASSSATSDVSLGPFTSEVEERVARRYFARSHGEEKTSQDERKGERLAGVEDKAVVSGKESGPRTWARLAAAANRAVAAQPSPIRKAEDEEAKEASRGTGSEDE